MTYSEDLRRAIQIAQALAKEYQHDTFGPSHLLRGLLHNEIGLASLLTSAGKDVHYARDWADVRLENLPKGPPVAEPEANDRIRAVLEVADLVRLQLNRDEIDAVAALTALLKPELAYKSEQLRSLPLTQKEVLEAVVETLAVDRVAGTPSTGSNGTAAHPETVSSTKTLDKYTIDRTALAAAGRLDPILGRDREVRMMLEILGRRSKPNVIIVGEPGVGKTALVDGFAQLLVAGQVPLFLQNARLFELDLGALVAGASYKGEVEDRLKNLLKELKQQEKAVLFIDEVHVLLDPQGSIGSGAVQLLKPELARGELTLIGATTNDEYRKYIETDEAFSRRFERLRVEEPDVKTATRMVQHLVGRYEQHHGLSVDPCTPAETVRLAKRYIKDRRLPDAALDLLDRTMAVVRLSGELSSAEISRLRTEFEQLENHTVLLDEPVALAEWQWFYGCLNDRVSPVLSGQLEGRTDGLNQADALREYIRSVLENLQRLAGTKRSYVNSADIAAVVSHKTGIPLGKLQSDERDKLLQMHDVLKQRVVGQETAVQALSEAILESRSGLTKAGQPIGSFFLLGPTGTGKTELAKALADFLFNDESFLIRFDMSEFKEEHSAALLYGAPPGYVGYEEGGLLVNKIREKPYSVVLFDEIEKAHPSVFDLFLQILDEGKLHDRLGKEGDFSNAVILFTSNIGSEYVIEQFGQGQTPGSTALTEIMSRFFRPEFLARLTEIVPFAPISDEMAVQIFDIQLRGLTGQLRKQGIDLKISSGARRYFALEGFTPKYGARQLGGVIRNQLRRPIARLIVSGELSAGSVVLIDLDANGGVSRVVRTAEETVNVALQ